MSRTMPLPLIRHLSRPLTPVLARLPITANQVTAASLALGLAAAWAVARGTPGGAIVAGALLVACYVLDNCDGEIARLKGQCSAFGAHFDSLVDWAVHTAFFIGLGLGVEVATNDDIWTWLGLAAGAGGTINYILTLWFAARDSFGGDADPAVGEQGASGPQNVPEWILFAFRELSRADFCFIVLALALADLLWVLLPMGAIGAQVYWLTQAIRRTREFHV